jgi:hypothetical protein
LRDLALVALALSLFGWWAVRSFHAHEPPLDRKLAALVSRLETRDSLYRRVVCGWISRALPAAADSLPRLFDPQAGPANRQRLAAHDALLALGENARPALPRLARALAHDDPVVRTYTLVVVAHLHPDAREFMRLVQTHARDLQVPLRHLCGVLRDEDERLREFAWACLDAAGPAAAAVARDPVIAIHADPATEASWRARAVRTLQCLEGATAPR